MTLNEKQFESITAAIIRYKSQPYNGSIAVMRTRHGRVMALGQRDLGWGSVTQGAPNIIDVPGSHLNMLYSPYVHTVAEKLIDWLSCC